MRHVKFLGVCLQIGNEFFEIPGRKVLSCHDHDWVQIDQADRCEVDIRFVGKVWIESDRGGVRSHLAHLDGVSIGVCAHRPGRDRKSTRLNSSHPSISYAVCCLKKKKARRLPRRSDNKAAEMIRARGGWGLT